MDINKSGGGNGVRGQAIMAIWYGRGQLTIGGHIEGSI